MAKPWNKLTIEEKQERFISGLVDVGEEMRDYIHIMNNRYARETHRAIVTLQKEMVKSLNLIGRIEDDYYKGKG